jgi:hypothetical protein
MNSVSGGSVAFVKTKPSQVANGSFPIHHLRYPSSSPLEETDPSIVHTKAIRVWILYVCPREEIEASIRAPNGNDGGVERSRSRRLSLAPREINRPMRFVTHHLPSHLNAPSVDFRELEEEEGARSCPAT